jgi:hypothetical protein
MTPYLLRHIQPRKHSLINVGTWALVTGHGWVVHQAHRALQWELGHAYPTRHAIEKGRSAYKCARQLSGRGTAG